MKVLERVTFERITAADRANTAAMWSLWKFPCCPGASDDGWHTGMCCTAWEPFEREFIETTALLAKARWRLELVDLPERRAQLDALVDALRAELVDAARAAIAEAHP